MRKVDYEQKRSWQFSEAGKNMYFPVFVFSEISSQYQRIRYPAKSTGRVHFLMNMLQYYAIQFLDNDVAVVDIRESHATGTEEEMRKIAQDLQVPFSKKCFIGTDIPMVMVSDFLVTVECSTIRTDIHVFVCSEQNLGKESVQNRLKIKTEFWRRKGVPTVILTEKTIRGLF